jgi:hypothetical protein
MIEMNMQAMMLQARKLQKEIEKTTNEIDNKEFKYENENILVVALGNNEIKKISIKNDQIIEDKELLEDVIIVAINDIFKQINKEKEEKLGKYTNGLGGLF